MSRINGRGTFLCYKYAAEQMIRQGRGGVIIGASSITAKQGEKYPSINCSLPCSQRELKAFLVSEHTARQSGWFGV